MPLNKFSKIYSVDLIKFIFYSTTFFVLFFAYNKAQSPIIEVEYNSASIYSNEEEKILDKEVEKIIKPTLTISFRPENIIVDKDLLEMLKININSSYFKEKVTPLHLVIDGETIDPRGQISGNKLILSDKINSDNETIKVFVHELGHIIDINYLKNLKNSSLTNIFYNINWLSYNIKKKEAKIKDFVSGYALSNKYEDFAESFTFFIFHNEEFEKRAKSNDFLKQKYNFFKDYVFNNKEFFNTSFTQGSVQVYNWDSTKMPINLKKYLYYIK